MDRRQFFFGVGAAVAAPAVIRKTILMPVKQVIIKPIYNELVYITRKAFIPSLVVQIYNNQNQNNRLALLLQQAQNTSSAAMIDNMRRV
jgi:hypothetical protein